MLTQPEPETQASWERDERRGDHEDSWLSPAAAARNERAITAREERRRRTIAEALPATASRKLGCSRAITGAHYAERAEFIRRRGAAALHQLDIGHFNSGCNS